MDDAQRAEKRGLGGKSRFSDDGLKLRRYKNRSWFSERGFPNGFPKDGFSIKKWFPKRWFLNQKMVSGFPKRWFLNQKMVSLKMVSQSKNGFPKDGFSIKKWFPKIWFLNQNLVNYMFPNQTSAFSRYPATDSSKCASATDSSCFRAIIEWFLCHGSMYTNI